MSANAKSIKPRITAALSNTDLTLQRYKPMFLSALTVVVFHGNFHFACFTLDIIKKLKNNFLTIYKYSYKKKVIKKIPTPAPTSHLVNNTNNM